jgi:hypothetical protein
MVDYERLVRHLTNAGWNRLASGVGSGTHAITMPPGRPTFTIACSGRRAEANLRPLTHFMVMCPGSGQISVDATHNLPRQARITVQPGERWTLFEKSVLHS